MPILTVGATAIPYTVRRSAKAKRRKISVTANDVEVVIPQTSKEEDVLEYLHKKREWIYNQREIIQEKLVEQQSISRFVTGAKIPYRGRMMRLRVERHDDTSISITFKNGFLVRLPIDLSNTARDVVLESEFRLWFKERLRGDVKGFVRQYGTRHGLMPKGFQIKEQKHLWGSCGKNRIINLNWHLIFAPKSVLEYAVVHELCHLQYRNHDDEFWGLLKKVMPDYEGRKRWLEENEGDLISNNF
ncbi:MAG: M48 family metallopeptidase [Magnetococcales bacterium]|nr:M48 family metallopeptidase [Magnetococcales bacterium]